MIDELHKVGEHCSVRQKILLKPPSVILTAGFQFAALIIGMQMAFSSSDTFTWNIGVVN